MSKAPATAVARKRQLRIASGCATRDAFITVFRRFCDRSSIFIATRTPKSVGDELNFSITLSDGTPLITGSGKVDAAYTDAKGTYGRPGMKIRFGELDSQSSRLVDELVATARARPPSLPPPRQPTPSRSIPAIPPIKPLPSVVGVARSKPPTPSPAVVPGPARAGLASTMMLTPVRATPLAGAKPDAAGEADVVVAPPAIEPSAKSAGGAAWDDSSGAFSGPTRVRGAKAVLPANPLGSIENDSLDAFIECTLYEDNGGFGEGEPTSPNFPDEPGHMGSRPASAEGDVSSRSITLPPFYAGPIPVEMDIVDSMKVPATLMRDALESLPAPASATTAAPALASGPAPTAAAPTESTADLVLPRAPRSHWPLTAGIAAGAALVGVLAGYLMGSGSAREAARAQATSSPAPAAAPASPPAAAPPVAAAPAETPPAAAAPALAVLTGDLAPDRCGLAIDSTPEGAEVSIGEQFAGQTPLRVELPCQVHEIQVRRVRYRDETRAVELHPGKLGKLEINLARPEHRLRVTSTPRGARVWISGRVEGSTPVSMAVPGYEQVAVRVEMDGYRPFTKKVYARKSTTVVSAKLTPERVAKPAARKAPATPTRTTKPASRKP